MSDRKAAHQRGHASLLRGAYDDRNVAVPKAVAQVQGRAEPHGIVAHAHIHAGDVRLAVATEQEVGALEFGRVEIHLAGPQLAHARQPRQTLVEQRDTGVGRKVDGGDPQLLAARARNGPPAASGMHDEPGAHLAKTHDNNVRRAQGSVALIIEGWVVGQ